MSLRAVFVAFEGCHTVKTCLFNHSPSQDEILPHGTMMELLRQGFSAAYDKVMYDRRHVIKQRRES